MITKLVMAVLASNATTVTKSASFTGTQNEIMQSIDQHIAEATSPMVKLAGILAVADMVGDE